MSLRLFILPKNLCVSNNASHLSPFTLTHGYVQRANTAQRESTPHSRQSKTNKGRVCHVLWDITTCADPVSAASTVAISKFKIVTLILRWTIKLYHFNHGSGVFDCLKRMTITCWVVYSTFLLSLKLSGRELAGRLLWRSLFFALANVVSWCFNAHCPLCGVSDQLMCNSTKSYSHLPLTTVASIWITMWSWGNFSLPLLHLHWGCKADLVW